VRRWMVSATLASIKGLLHALPCDTPQQFIILDRKEGGVAVLQPVSDLGEGVC